MIFGKNSQQSKFERFTRLSEGAKKRVNQLSNKANEELLIAAQKGYSNLPLSTRVKNIDTVSLTGYIFAASAVAILVFLLSIRSILAVKEFKKFSNEKKNLILANETNAEAKKVLFAEYENQYTTQLTF